MRKKIASIMICVLLAASLAGCGGQGAGGETAQTPAPAPEQTESAQPEAEPEAAAPEQAAEGENAQASGGAQAAAFDEYARPLIKPEGNLTVGYITNNTGAESMIRSNRQAEIEVARRGWTLKTVTFTTDQEAIDGFNNLVQQGVDAIILTGISSMSSKVDMFVKAREAGIGIYCNDNQVVDGIISNCTQPNAIAAMELLYKVGEDYLWEANCAILTVRAMNMHIERTDPMKSLMGNGAAYPTLNFLSEQDIPATTTSPAQDAYQLTQTWLQKYGTDMDIVFTSADLAGIAAAEAIAASGDTTGENTIACGIDGGSQAWAYIRNNTPFKYSYAQAFELFTHNCFELVDQIQVQGLNPGDEGCLIEKAGQTVYSTGFVVTQENVPAIGDSIHAVFNYYGGDPEDPDAWYNWDDGKGIYTISDGEE